MPSLRKCLCKFTTTCKFYSIFVKGQAGAQGAAPQNQGKIILSVNFIFSSKLRFHDIWDELVLYLNG